MKVNTITAVNCCYQVGLGFRGLGLTVGLFYMYMHRVSCNIYVQIYMYKGEPRYGEGIVGSEVRVQGGSSKLQNLLVGIAVANA